MLRDRPGASRPVLSSGVGAIARRAKVPSSSGTVSVGITRFEIEPGPWMPSDRGLAGAENEAVAGDADQGALAGRPHRLDDESRRRGPYEASSEACPRWSSKSWLTEYPVSVRARWRS